MKLEGRRLLRWSGVVAALVGWTFLVGSCAGVAAMSGAEEAESDPGIPWGATVALIVLGVVWIAVPVVVLRRRSRRLHEMA